MTTISSKPFHMTQLVAGDKFRFKNGRFFFTVVEQKGTYVVATNRLVPGKTYNLPCNKVVIKFKQKEGEA